jgi:hypothetical protein
MIGVESMDARRPVAAPPVEIIHRALLEAREGDKW